MKYVNSHSGFAVMVKVGHCGSVFIVISPNCVHGIAVHRCGLLLQMFRGFSVNVSVWERLQCFDTVGWAAGRASGL